MEQKHIRGDMMIEQMCKLAINSMPFSVWIKDRQKKFLFVNAIYASRHNREIGDFIGKTNDEVFGKKLSTQFNQMLEEVSFTKVIKRYKLNSKQSFLEYVIFPLLDENKEIQGFVGLIFDVSNLKDKETELENQKNILRTIIDTLPHYIFYKDKNYKYVGYNKKWKDYYYEKGNAKIEGKDDFELGIEEDIARMYRQKDEEVMQKKKEIYVELHTKENEQDMRIEECIKVPVMNEKGEVWGLVGIARDITERKMTEQKLRYLSYTDQLTGLNNRTSFEEKVIALNKEEFLPLGVIMGDVNGLKMVNDTFGHLAGDKLLCEIGTILKTVSGTESYVFRWGGDEFVIIVPRCDTIKCNQIMNEIIETCESKKKELIQLSISLGESIKTTIEEDVYGCLKRAEEKVYCQKLLKEKSIRSDIIESLQNTLAEKNMETKQHTERLFKYAKCIGERMGMTRSQLDELILVTKLHDIGKIGINENILLKQGTLTNKEFEIMKTHSEKGFRILQTTSELSHIARGVLTHHERWDGAGYPLGLKGEEIPVTARIVNIIDAYDAMTHDQTYKKAMTKEEAIKELIANAKKQFDPKILLIFLEILEEEDDEN